MFIPVLPVLKGVWQTFRCVLDRIHMQISLNTTMCFSVSIKEQIFWWVSDGPILQNFLLFTKQAFILEIPYMNFNNLLKLWWEPYALSVWHRYISTTLGNYSIWCYNFRKRYKSFYCGKQWSVKLLSIWMKNLKKTYCCLNCFTFYLEITVLLRLNTLALTFS